MDAKQLQEYVSRYFEETFGRTMLRPRLEDICKEAAELKTWGTVDDLRAEFGDLLASVLAGIQECGFDAETLIQENRRKIFLRRDQYRALGRKSLVAIFGGAFNPITKGHIAVAQFVLRVGIFDEVWLTPCHNHMYNKKLVSSEHRLAMCNLAAAGDPRIQCFDYEIKNELAGETYHFIKRLQAEDFAQDQYSFSILIGMDNANTFHQWVNFEDLERLIPFVVIPRTGETQDPKVDWYLKGRHLLLRPEKDELPNTSSTEARLQLDISNCPDPKSVATRLRHLRNDILDPKVLDYIQVNNLYGLQIPVS